MTRTVGCEWEGCGGEGSESVRLTGRPAVEWARVCAAHRRSLIEMGVVVDVLGARVTDPSPVPPRRAGGARVQPQEVLDLLDGDWAAPSEISAVLGPVAPGVWQALLEAGLIVEDVGPWGRRYRRASVPVRLEEPDLGPLQRVVDVVRAEPGLTRHAIAERLGEARLRDLERLVDMGALEARSVAGRRRYWPAERAAA